MSKMKQKIFSAASSESYQMSCLSENLTFIYLPASVTYIYNRREKSRGNYLEIPVNDVLDVTGSAQPRWKKHACSKCHKEFTNKHKLNRHSVVHTDEKPYICDICQKGFNQKSNLKQHKLNQHKSTPKNVVGVILPSSKQDARTCLVCQKVFQSHYRLIRHSIVHTGEKPYICDVCHKGFNQKSNLKQHKSTHKKIVGVIFSSSKQDARTCLVCQKVFQSHSMLIRHSVVHTGVKPYICDICQKSFNQKSNLKQHKYFHRKDGASSQLVDRTRLECGKVCHTKLNLNQHSAVHFNKKPFSEKDFTQKFSLNKNLTRLKEDIAVPSCTREDTQICHQCGKVFSTKWDLKHHSLIHKKLKFFNFDVCTEEKISSSKEHKLDQTEDNAIGIASSSKSLLESHTCLACGKAFRTKCHLKQHSVEHTQIKSYVCDVCKKAFSHKGDLEQHKLVHVSEKPFQCDVCGKAYRHKVSLKVHTLVHKGSKLNKS